MPENSSGRTTLAFLLAALCAAGPARADEGERARALTDRAQAAFAAHQFADAARHYLDAHALIPQPVLLYNAGLALERVGRCAEVVALFERYLTERPAAENPELQAHLAEARRCAPEVAVDSVPAGAQVEIDGSPRGAAPVTLRLKHGTHRLRLTLDGHVPVDQAFAVEPGRPLVLSRRLVAEVQGGSVMLDVPGPDRVLLDGVPLVEGPYRGLRAVAAGPHVVRAERAGCEPYEVRVEVLAAAPLPLSVAARCPEAPTTGTLRLAIPPSVQVRVDGRALPFPTPAEATVPAGEHVVRVEAPGCTARDGTVTVAAGAVLQVSMTPDCPPPAVDRTWTWVTLGVGSAGVVTGAVLTALTLDAVDQADAEQRKDEPSGKATRAARDTATDRAIGANVAFGVGAAGLLTAAILFWTGDDEAPALTPALVPAGVGVRGTW